MYLVLLFFCFLGALHPPASEAGVKIRLGEQKNATRVVLESEKPFSITVKTTSQGLEITLSKDQFKGPLPCGKGLVSGVSAEGQEISLKTTNPPHIEKKFFISPSAANSTHRWVLDLTPEKTVAAPPPKIIPPPDPQKIIVIDAGHGGTDPGSISSKRVQEKEVTLACAHILAAKLRQNKNYKVILTRTGDFFLPLGERVNKGRLAKGSLFISLHADSCSNPLTRGISIYTLSKTASDKEAERLAAKENSADLLGGPSFKGHDQEVTSILMDLTKRETMTFSQTLSENLEKSFQEKGVGLLDRPRRSANFSVLRTPDIPAVLIELGYLSNKDDVKLLLSPSYFQKISDCIAVAVERFFAK